MEWYEALSLHLKVSQSIRHWFINNMLFMQSHRFCEYLLECPSTDVRSAFGKIIVFLAHYALQDGSSGIYQHVPSTQGKPIDFQRMTNLIIQKFFSFC